MEQFWNRGLAPRNGAAGEDRMCYTATVLALHNSKELYAVSCDTRGPSMKINFTGQWTYGVMRHDDPACSLSKVTPLGR